MPGQQQNPLDAILEHAVDAIIIINSAGIIEAANPATTTMFGYSLDELMGKNINILMPEPYHSEHDGYIERYLRTGEKRIIGIGREAVARRRDGREFPVHVAVSDYKEGNRQLFTGIIRDISDLKATQSALLKLNNELERRVAEKTEQLEAAQAELLKTERLATLGRVSGGLAHEIRNPLNAVKTSVYYLLNARSLTPEKTREHLERIDRQVTVIDNVLTALTDVALMPEPRIEPIDVGVQVAEVISQLGLPDGIEVYNELQGCDDKVLVHADIHQLPIVLRNLLRNARDSMPTGGRIVVGATENAQEVCILVRDTGQGIAPEHLDKVTEPFFSTKARGMGLGLAISKAILEKNGGRLEVESQLGVGSIFKLYFPRVGDNKPSRG
jgi:two-component system sensor kinase FixL